VTTAAKYETTSAPLAVLLQTRVRGLASENTPAIGLQSSLSSTLRWGSWQIYDATASARLVGLDFFGARYFSGAQGRFTSPDKPFADQHPGDPQSWNLYSYVRNNPLKFTDPNGHLCLFGKIGSCSQPSVTSTVSYPEVPLYGSNGGNAATILSSVHDSAGPVVNGLAVLTPAVPLIAAGAAAAAVASAATVATVGTAGVAAAESPQGQQAIAGLLPAAQNGVQWAGEITTSVTQSATTMFRVWGGASQQAGAWLTPNMPASPSAAISSLSLPLGNAAQFVSQVTVPAGTLIQSGTAAPLFGQAGGGAQVLLLQYLPLVNFGPGVHF